MIYALAHDVFLFSSGFTLEAKGCTPPPPFFPLSCIFKNSFYLYFFEKLFKYNRNDERSGYD